MASKRAKGVKQGRMYVPSFPEEAEKKRNGIINQHMLN
jgi:hypothetical protein